MKGVNDCLLDNCQISSLPHDCVAKWTNWEMILKAQETFAGVLSWLADWHVTIFKFVEIVNCWVTKTSTTSVCVHWIYLIHVFHNLSWISRINKLFYDILIYWDAPIIRAEFWKNFLIKFVSGSQAFVLILFPIQFNSIQYVTLDNKTSHK